MVPFIGGCLQFSINLHRRVIAFSGENCIDIQDFTDKSDIDWSKSSHEIDMQLYRKYKLTDNEISLIETFIQ